MPRRSKSRYGWSPAFAGRLAWRAGIESLSGRELGVAVARALIDFERQVGLPTTLSEVPGFGPAHIERALTAAKSPQLKMKLENMPVPLRRNGG